MQNPEPNIPKPALVGGGPLTRGTTMGGGPPPGLANFHEYLKESFYKPDFVYDQVFGTVSAQTGFHLVFVFENMTHAFAVPVSVETYKNFQPCFSEPKNLQNLSIYS